MENEKLKEKIEDLVNQVQGMLKAKRKGDEVISFSLGNRFNLNLGDTLFWRVKQELFNSTDIMLSPVFTIQNSSPPCERRS